MFFKRLRQDINAAKRNDPAARNKFEIWLTYSGVHALSWHRGAQFFYKIKLKLLARMISQFAKFLTGIEIHPAAKIEGGVFIDQGVTLGGTGKEKGKRHPTIEKDCIISAGAKVLGGFTVGEGAKIGAGAVVLKKFPRTRPWSAFPAESCASRAKNQTFCRKKPIRISKRSARCAPAWRSWKPRS